MLDKEHKNLDTVNVSTPDHMHAAQAMSAMQLGLNVYGQKPLAHDVFEFPISPAELKAKTGWHTTVDAEIDVVACLKGRLMSS